MVPVQLSNGNKSGSRQGKKQIVGDRKPEYWAEIPKT
jgi:hypothetical protein